MDLLLGATLYNTEIESVCKGKDKAAWKILYQPM